MATAIEVFVESVLAPGAPVEVSNLFTGRWCGGFRVVAREAEGYRIARASDGTEVPALFGPGRLRPAAG